MQKYVKVVQCNGENEFIFSGLSIALNNQLSGALNFFSLEDELKFIYPLN